MPIFKYNDTIKFMLPPGFKCLREEDEDGKYARILTGKYYNDQGETNYSFECRVEIYEYDPIMSGQGLTTDNLLERLAESIDNSRRVKLPGDPKTILLNRALPFSVLVGMVKSYATIALVQVEDWAVMQLISYGVYDDEPNANSERSETFFKILRAVRVHEESLPIDTITPAAAEEVLRLSFVEDGEALDVTSSLHFDDTPDGVMPKNQHDLIDDVSLSFAQSDIADRKETNKDLTESGVSVPETANTKARTESSANESKKTNEDRRREDFFIRDGVVMNYFGTDSEVAVPEEVEAIGLSAFKDCNSLTSIRLPNGLKRIDSFAFSGCCNLSNITLPDGLATIGFSAFRDCRSLTSITFPDSLTSIEGHAFNGCGSLKSIVLPDGVKRIGRNAFRDCSSLTDVTIPDSLSLDADVFEGCNSLKLNKSNEKEHYQSAVRSAKEDSDVSSYELVKEKSRKKWIVPILIGLVVLLIGSFWIYLNYIKPGVTYNNAEEMLSEGQYNQAIALFDSLGTYKDSPEKTMEAKYQKAQYLFDEGNYGSAKLLYNQIIDYEDSARRIKECDYWMASKDMERGFYLTAISQFEELGHYKDSSDKLKKCTYQLAKKYMDTGNYSSAKSRLQDLGDYLDSKELIKECIYLMAKEEFESENYDEALELFSEIPEYKDANEYIRKINNTSNEVKSENLQESSRVNKNAPIHIGMKNEDVLAVLDKTVDRSKLEVYDYGEKDTDYRVILSNSQAAELFGFAALESLPKITAVDISCFDGVLEYIDLDTELPKYVSDYSKEETKGLINRIAREMGATKNARMGSMTTDGLGSITKYHGTVKIDGVSTTVYITISGNKITDMSVRIYSNFEC